LGVDAAAISAEVYGLNHLSFYSNIKLNGGDITRQIIEDERSYTESDLRFFDKELVRHLDCVPNEYLYYYFYPEKALENIRGAEKTRGELIEEINRNMLRELSQKDVGGTDEKSFHECLSIYEKWYAARENMYMANETGVGRAEGWKLNLNEEGGYAGVALQFIEAAKGIRQNRSMVLCVPNGKAIPGLAPDDIVEASCDIVSGEAVPHSFAAIPPAHFELIRRVKVYERLAAKAIIEKDLKLAKDALALHPLAGSYSVAMRLAPRYFELNAAYTGGGKGVR
jgi:6-phospho-beta-glucosidase